MRVDLTQHGAAYYFHSRDPDMEFARAALALHELGTHRGSAGRILQASIHGFARTLVESFVDEGPDTRAVLRAYARDHGREAEAERLRARVAELRSP